MFNLQSDSSRSVTPCSDSQEGGGSDTSTCDEGIEEQIMKVSVCIVKLKNVNQINKANTCTLYQVKYLNIVCNIIIYWKCCFDTIFCTLIALLEDGAIFYVYLLFSVSLQDDHGTGIAYPLLSHTPPSSWPPLYGFPHKASYWPTAWCHQETSSRGKERWLNWQESTKGETDQTTWPSQVSRITHNEWSVRWVLSIRVLSLYHVHTVYYWT